jgi:hypothetical protein
MSSPLTRAKKRVVVVLAVLAGATISTFSGLVVVAGLCVVTAFHRSRIPLENGYYVFREDLSSECICDPTRQVLLHARIAEIGENEGFIVGRVAPPIDGFKRYEPFPIGYFMIQRATNQITSGLTSAELEAQLGGPAPKMYDPKVLALWRW